MKNYAITQEQFSFLTQSALSLRNAHSKEIKDMAKNGLMVSSLKDFHQREIDNINEIFDQLNAKFNTNL